MSEYYIGLDLGQTNDYTALAVIQKAAGDELHLRHLERYELGTPYTTIADYVKALLSGPPFTEYQPIGGKMRMPGVELIVDRTGVGVAVTDLLSERRINYVGVTITGLGQKAHKTGLREYNVPKADLVAALEVPFHTGRLKIADNLELWPVLRGELLSFRRKQNKITAHISYEHWRESDHDDLVLACALACWKATYKRKGTTKLRLIS